MRRNGFTLVELSIVLVIIGLLIGGVLVGQSLIESAKVKNFIKRHTSMEVAVNQFKVKYKSLPGEGPSTTSLMNNHNGCRMSNGNINANGVYDDTNYELSCMWTPLWKSGFWTEKLYKAWSTSYIDCGDPGYVDSTLGCYPRPIANIKGAIRIGTVHPSVPQFGFYWHYYAGDDPSDLNFGFMTPSMALAIDQKIDDGKSWGGWAGERVYSRSTTSDGKTCVGAGNAYNVSSSDERACNTNIKFQYDGHVF